MRGFLKRWMSPIAARKLAATITFTPGTRHQPLDLSLTRARPERSAARPRRSPRRGTRSGACALSTVSRSSSASSSSASHARPLTPNRSETGGRPTSWRISTAWISFFARCAPAPAAPRRDSRRRITHVARSGIQTASSDPAASSLASVRASRRSVFARAWRIPVSDGLTTSTCATCGSRIRAISHAFARHLKRHPIIRGQAPSEQLELLRLGLDPASRAHARRPRRSRPRRNPDAHPTRPTLTSPPPPNRIDTMGDAVGKRHRRIRARSATGQVAGAANEKPGLERPSRKTACPTCVLPKSPCPSDPTLRPEP